VLTVLKSGCLNLLEPSGHVQACNGNALLLPYVTGHNRVTQKFGIGGGGGVGEGDVIIKYRYQPLGQVTKLMAQNQEVSFHWKGTEALSSNEAMTYVEHKDITDLNVTRNTS